MAIINKILCFISENYEALAFLTVVIGGVFALTQWKTQIKHKQAEMVKELICKVRDDEDISMIMDIIDWNKDIQYDGKFKINPSAEKTVLTELDEDVLFKKIDKTLSHFSYICYLKKRHNLKQKDILPFEYELRRLIDNPHIKNYLYSLYHWSKYLDVKCSFCYLIDYCLKKNYLESDFESRESYQYNCYLSIPNSGEMQKKDRGIRV